MAGDILTPMPDDQIGRLALIEAVRAQTDQMARLVRAEEARDTKLETIKDQIGEMRTNIALLQKDSPGAAIADLQRRVAELEAFKQHQKGERSVWAAIIDSKLMLWLLGALSTAGAYFIGTNSGGHP